MRYLFGFIFVLALGVMPMVGCGETSGTGGGGGTAGAGGDRGTGGIGDEFPCTLQGIHDAIAKGGGPHTFGCDEPTTVVTESEIVIDNDVILDGESKLTVAAVGGEERYRVFRVPLTHSVTAELRGITVSTGGIIVNGPGTLTLTDCIVMDSISDSPLGGGIDNSGSLTMRGCTVSSNNGGKGGGIFNDGSAMLFDTTVSHNNAASGGGIFNVGSMSLSNSTISGNDAFAGGGIFNEGALVLTHVTFSENVSEDFGGAIWSDRGTVEVVNSLVDGDCSGEGIESHGHNTESPGDSCGFDERGDRANLPGWWLNLRPLADNGGPTETHALGEGSFAIDRIPPEACALTADQRGQPRPSGPNPAWCDVGAFEVQVRFACTEQGIRDAIAVGGGPHRFDCSGPTTVITDSEIVIDKDVILDGEGYFEVDGDEDHRVLSVGRGVTAEIRGFTVEGGGCASFDCYGSAIRNLGTLTLMDSTLSNNRGIALLNEASMVMVNCTMWNPDGAPDGVHNGTDTGEQVPETLTIVNSTLEDMVQNFGALTLTHSTVDRVDTQYEGSVAIANSVVRECVDAERPKSEGYNIESPGNTCGFGQPTDQVNVSVEDLRLGELADNGGPTWTHALFPGSVAIDVIPADMCEVDEDQRGEPRDSMCDVGAFEVQP